MEINPAIYTAKPTIQEQNLVKETRVTQFVEPPGFWRAIALDFLSVASALFFGYSYFLYLTTGLSPWYLLAGALIYSAFTVIQVFLAQGILRRMLIILAEVAAMVVAFVFYDDWRVVAVAGAVTFAILFWGYLMSRSLMKNQVEIRFFATSRNVLGKLVTAALLFLIIVYAPQAQGRGIFIPRSSFKTFFDWSAAVLNNFYPGVSFSDSYGTFASSFVKAELAHNPTFTSLTPTEQSAAVAQATAGFTASVAQATGITPTQAESVSDVAYDYIVATLSNWQNRFNDQFMIIWAIILFLVFRMLAFIFVWAAQLVSLVVYEIFLAAGFMRIEGVPQTKEVINY